MGRPTGFESWIAKKEKPVIGNTGDGRPREKRKK